MDALNQGFTLQAFICLRNMIYCLNPADKKDLKENDLAHIEQQITSILVLKSFDEQQTRMLQGAEMRRLSPAILELFERARMHGTCFINA
jgi:hypothetical protein